MTIDKPALRFGTGYLDDALFEPTQTVERAVRDLEGADFDTLVGTGFSGALIVPMLATALRKNFVLVRKEGDGSHHSGRIIGNLGKRWIFVDDFVSSGVTRERVALTIADVAATTEQWDITIVNFVKGFETECVGEYLYANKPWKAPRWCPTGWDAGLDWTDVYKMKCDDPTGIGCDEWVLPYMPGVTIADENRYCRDCTEQLAEEER